MSRITTKVERTIVDKDTGEVVDAKEYRYTKSHEPYFQLFLTDIDLLFKVDNKAQYKLFFCMLFHVQYEHAHANIVKVTSSLKEDAESVGIKGSRFYNVISGLVKSDLIRRTQRGEYMVNPRVFYNGSYKNRKNSIGYYANLDRV